MHALGQAVHGHAYLRLLGELDLVAERQAALAHALDRERPLRGVVEAYGAVIERLVSLEAADHDLQHAVQVLSLADSPRQAIEEIEPMELRAQPLLGLLVVLD